MLKYESIYLNNCQSYLVDQPEKGDNKRAMIIEDNSNF